MDQTLRDLIKAKASRLGFHDCGVAPVHFLVEESERLNRWLDSGYAAGMDYMTRNTEMRLHPGNIAEGARSVIVFLHNYFPTQYPFANREYRISRYALGNDYHSVIKKKLKEILELIAMHNPGSFSRAFTDSAPVLERAWATRAGLGWIGKNSMLISRKAGSWFFISEIITTAELPPDLPFGGNYCGDCSRCLDACPTGAITEPYVIDANKCISYLTIENKGDIPERYSGTYNHWIFGCDICQEVCPWNRFAFAHQEPAFTMNAELAAIRDEDWENLKEEQFQRIFDKSAVKRAKFDGLKRNIRFVQPTNNQSKEL